MGDLVLWSCRQKEGRERKEWMLGNISHYVSKGTKVSIRAKPANNVYII